MPRSEAGPAGCKREPRAAAARPPSAPVMLFHASQDSQQQLATMPRCLNFPAVPHQRIGLQPSRAVHRHATFGTHSCCCRCHTVTHRFSACRSTSYLYPPMVAPLLTTMCCTFHTQSKNSVTEVLLAGGHIHSLDWHVWRPSHRCRGMLPADPMLPSPPAAATSPRCRRSLSLLVGPTGCCASPPGPLRSPSSRGPRTHCVRAPQAAASPLTDTHHQQAKNQCRCAAGRHPTAALPPPVPPRQEAIATHATPLLPLFAASQAAYQHALGDVGAAVLQRERGPRLHNHRRWQGRH